MTFFWVLAVVLCVVAAAFVLLPLYLRKEDQPVGSRVKVNLGIYEERLSELEEGLAAGDIDEDEFSHLKTELQKNLVTDADEQAEEQPRPQASTRYRSVPVALAILVPLFAFIAYSDWGLSWGAIEDYQIARELKSGAPHDMENMAGVIRRLERRLEEQPDNHEGWFLLGQSYMSMGLYNKAAEAFRHLEKTFPQDDGLASYLAESLYMADDRRFTGRVEEAVNRTLELNPKDITMLEIRGLGAYQNGRPEEALNDFRAALAAGAAGRRAQAITSIIERIESQAGIDVAENGDTAAPVSSGAEDKPSRRLSVRVEVQDGLELDGDETVFVYARALQGPPMPLAVQRFGVSALPRVVNLDESMAMMPGMGLANFDRVQVVARISTAGIADVSPDDFQAVSDAVDLTGETSLITLRISERVGTQ